MCRWRENWQVSSYSSRTQKLGPSVSRNCNSVVIGLQLSMMLTFLKWNIKKACTSAHQPPHTHKIYIYIYFRCMWGLMCALYFFQCSTKERKARRGTSSRKGLSTWLSMARCVFLHGCKCFCRENVICKEQVKMWRRPVLSTLKGLEAAAVSKSDLLTMTHTCD